MTFGQAVATCMGKYATFSGRASRSEFWWFYLFYFLVYIGAWVVGFALGIAGMLLAILVLLALAIPLLAAAVRRLHDTGRSAWWLLFALIPLVGGILLIVLWAQDTQPDDRYGAPSN